MKTFGFVMLADEKYLPYCLFAASSIKTHSLKIKKVLILVNCIDQKSQLEDIAREYELTLIYAEEEPELIWFLHEMKMLKVSEKRYVTTTTFLKLILIRYFRNKFDRIVYLDTDLLLFGGLDELFSLDLEDSPIGAIRDFRSRELVNNSNVRKYFNAGLLVFDLNHAHIESLAENLLTQLQTSRNSKYQDQDVLNAVFDEKWFEISNRYNFQIAFRYPDKKHNLESIAVFHFVGPFKPWKVRLGRYHESWESEYKKFQTAHPHLIPVIYPRQASLGIRILISASTIPLISILPLSIRVVLASLISKKF